MNAKRIFNGVVLIAIVMFLSSNYSTAADHNSYKKAIERVIQEDKHLSQQKKDEADSDDATIQYAHSMRKINLSKCPLDFQAAYILHVSAWDRYAKILANFPKKPDGFIENILSFFVAIEVYDKLYEAQKAISDTWKSVEVVAAKYGVSVL